MKNRIAPFFLAAALFLSVLRAADESDFKSLFNGKDFTGWDGDPKFWRVESGVIVGETTDKIQPADHQNTFLIYRPTEFANFELRFKYKVEGFNSGMNYRSIDKGGFHVIGPQADFQARWQPDIDKPGSPLFDKYTGMFFDEGNRLFMGQRGDVVIVRANRENPKKPKIEKIGSVGDLLELEKAIRRDDWNDYTIVATSNQFTHIINGRVFAIGIDEDELNYRKSGILALQLHAGKAMRIDVKDIRIRELK